ncbi:MAG: class I SAM-dependent methyltransferase [Promethearchaeota archaeon]
MPREVARRAKEFYEDQHSYLTKKSIYEYETETLDGLWNYIRIFDHTERFLCIKSFLSDQYIENKSFVDVGCGRGPVVWYHLGLLAKYSYIVGLDINLIILKRNKDLFRNKYSFVPIDFCLCDACYLPLKDKSIDVSVCSEVLEHLPEYIPAIKELSRISKNQIIPSIPDAGISGVDYEFNKSGHLHVINASQLVSLLMKEGWMNQKHYRIGVIWRFIERKLIRRIEKNWHSLAIQLAKIIITFELKIGRTLVNLRLPRQFSGFHILNFVKN